MLLNRLSKYLESVEKAIRKLEGAYVERYEEEILTVNRVNLRIRVRFQTGHMLEINEAIIGQESQIMHIGYRYHFQDINNSVSFGMTTRHIFQSLILILIISIFLKG